MSAKAEPERAAPSWQNELYELLRRPGVTQFASVPDAGHRALIDRSLTDPEAYSVALTTEEEGVALLAGSGFGRHGEGFLRLSFANSIEELDEGLQRLKRGVERLRRLA